MVTLHPAQESLREVIRSGQVGNWKLTENLGRGGQGTTFRAIWSKETSSLTQVALGGHQQHRSVVKLMIPPDPSDYPVPTARFDDFLEHLVGAFVEECMVLDSIRNPYIPDFFQASRQDANAGWPVPWFAVELIEGRSLSAQRKLSGPLDQNQLLELAHDLLSALDALHSAGLIHLDLKPDNVMLEPGKSRLIDFGLATQAYRVQPGISGTPGYFAPEQLDDIVEERDFAPEVDLFKLGVTLAWAAGIDLPDLWGVDPFKDQSALHRSIRNGANLSSLKPAVRHVVAPLLSFDPTRRPTAGAALEQVKDALPTGSSRASTKARSVSPPRPQRTSLTPAAKAPAAASNKAPTPARPVTPAPTPTKGEANVGAKVVVVDRLGLDWAGVVVGSDPKRPGNVLVRHESTRGNENVRSYPLNQVARGAPLK